MTGEILLTLAILVAAVVLFVTEWLRMDTVALLVMVALALTGLVTPEQALAGFSSPAVVTVWAVFILSGGLSRTGVANLVGKQIVRVAGEGEARLVVVIMITAAVLSAFMNNVGVAALLLPVVVSIARRTGNHPSRLLMPMAAACLLGGMTTLIGTPPNILASDVLRDAGEGALQLFDFLPVGGIITLAGVLFMALAGRRLLSVPEKPSDPASTGRSEIEAAYVMGERLCRITIPDGSPLDGKTLADTRLSAALGLTVLEVRRKNGRVIAPEPVTRIQAGDALTVVGRLDHLAETRGHPFLEIESDRLTVSDLVDENLALAEIRVTDDASFLGRTLRQIRFRQRYGLIALAMRRNGETWLSRFDTRSLREGDTLLVLGERERVDALAAMTEFECTEVGKASLFDLEERLLEVRIPEDSPLIGKSLAESELSDLAGVVVLGVVRDGEVRKLVDPQETVFQAGDLLYVKGNVRENLESLQALQDLMIHAEYIDSLSDLETEQTALLEVVLSPHSRHHGKTLGQIHFRQQYDLNVVAIYREGRAIRSHVGEISLRFGDALLLHGPREKLALIARDPNFISLVEEIQPSPRLAKAPLSLGIMLAVVLTVLFGWLPISIAAVAGALLMVLTGCLTMDEAYHEIEWRAVFLIAGMLPLGAALESTGTAVLFADAVFQAIGVFGVLPMIAGLFLITVIASQIMPNPVVVVLMAPIALVAAGEAGLSRTAIMMVIAVGASASFLSPVGHPANLLVMGPGGYRFKDYIRVGLPLTVITALIVLFVLPVFWPLQ